MLVFYHNFFFLFLVSYSYQLTLTIEFLLGCAREESFWIEYFQGNLVSESLDRHLLLIITLISCLEVEDIRKTMPKLLWHRY